MHTYVANIMAIAQHFQAVNIRIVYTVFTGVPAHASNCLGEMKQKLLQRLTKYSLQWNWHDCNILTHDAVPFFQGGAKQNMGGGGGGGD